MIPYAGYDPTERHCRPSMPHRESFAYRVMDAFDRGFDSASIACLYRAPEHVVAKTIEQMRELRR